MRERGHVLLLLMVALSASLVSLAVFSDRLNLDIEARASTDLRTQALWLARSAVSAGVSGVHEVETSAGVAVVRVERLGAGVSARVTLGGASAIVTTSPAEERYVGPSDEPGGPPGG